MTYGLEQVRHEVRFALSQFRARNGQHEFETITRIAGSGNDHAKSSTRYRTARSRPTVPLCGDAKRTRSAGEMWRRVAVHESAVHK